MRHATACAECRTDKRRCSTTAGQPQCHQCLRKGVSCSRMRDAHPATSPRRCDSIPRQASELDVFDLHGANFVTELIHLYLSLIHDRPHSLFHVETLWRDVSSRTIPKGLLLCLCAIGARLSPKPQTRAMAMSFTQWAKKAVNSQIENICLQTVQSYILLANICAADLEPSLEALYFGMAIRMAHILALNRVNPTDNAILRETKCRVWWTLVMADVWCSTGLDIPRQLRAQSSHINLPGDEFEFQNLRVNSPLHQWGSSRPGLWAYMIQLVDIFGPINDLHHQLVASTLQEDEFHERVSALAARLEAWKATLPAHLQLNYNTLGEHKQRQLGGPFVALHLGYFHYSTLLYFRYLDKKPSQDPLHEDYARRCRALASSYSKLLQQSRDLQGCDVIYVTVGHMTVVSSSVLLHTLLFGPENQLAETRQNLTSNFAALIDLRTYWPCLERTMRRLLEFQNSCLRREGHDTHGVDEWMVRFLTEHSLPLDMRVESLKPHGVPIEDSNTTFADSGEHTTRESMATQALADLWGDSTSAEL